MKTRYILFIIIILNLFLNVYGNDWGLPWRWHSDEKVVNVLHMADQKTLIDPVGAFLHPTGHHMFLMLSFIPVFIYLKLTDYPLGPLKEAASVSWYNMASLFPGFAAGIYIYARTLSALLGALTVYLVYLIGKEIYDKKTGLFSAVSLAVCMGFIGINHFAKHMSLANFLIALTLFWCIKSVRENNLKNARRYLFFGSLSAGYALSTMINAILLPFPLLLGLIFYIFKWRGSFKEIIYMIAGCLCMYCVGILTGTPSLLTNAGDYIEPLSGVMAVPSAGVAIQRPPALMGVLNYALEIASIYGIPMFILLILGIFSSIFSRIIREEIIILSFVAAYYFIAAVFLADMHPETKHIIAIVPLLAVFAGRSAVFIYESGKIPKITRYLILISVFLYSFAYSLKADLYLKSGDTRYGSTRWVNENIPKGSKIEIFDQLHYVASPSIMKDHDIIYFGRNSRTFKDKRIFKWSLVENRDEYFQRLNKYGSSSDYIMIEMDDFGLEQIMNSDLSASDFPDRERYFLSLFNGTGDFNLVKVVRPKNYKVMSGRINGLIYFKNMWWDPVPDYRATANTIYIFKK